MAGRLVGYAAALGAVGLVSAFIGLVLARVHVANISMLYLLAVFASAILFGSGPAVLASVAAFLTFDWFFVEPYYTFTVADPEEWIALVFFLATALVTGQLAAALRRWTDEARQREREAAVLYDVVRVLNGPDLERALQAVVERLRRELGLAAVLVRLRVGDYFSAQAQAGEAAAVARARSLPTTGGQMLPLAGARDGAPRRWVRVVTPRPPGEVARGSDVVRVVPVQVPAGRAGEILLVREPNDRPFSAADDRLLRATAAQVAAAAERARLQREATEAEVLRRTDKLKSALINAVSHDVRTPLASIMTAAGSLKQDDVSWTPEERREFAEDIEHETRRLNRIFGNLLDLSRMEGGSLRPEKGWYDVGALVDDVVGRLRPVTARHRVLVDVPEDLPPAHLDATEVDQVLSNLIENAAKYTPPGTEIAVRARRDGPNLRVEVADRGPGIPPSALPHLFEPFYRGSTSSKGLGLGLTIARGLVEAHGGRLWAENRSDGGARFVLELPIGADAQPRMAEAS